MTAEELFVIEKFTGFNRFRDKLSQATAPDGVRRQSEPRGSEGAVALRFRYRRAWIVARPWKKSQANGIERWEKSYCPYCGVGCGLLAKIRGGAVTRIKGDPDHPSSLGDLCLKAIYLPEVIQTHDRLALSSAAPMSGRPFQAGFLAAGR